MANNLSTGEKWGIAGFVTLFIAILAFIFWPSKSTNPTEQVGDNDYDNMTRTVLITKLVAAGQERGRLDSMTQEELIALAKSILGTTPGSGERSMGSMRVVTTAPAYAVNDNNTINGIIDTFMNNSTNRSLSRQVRIDRINEQIQSRGLNYVVYEKGQTVRQAPKGTVVCCCWDETRTFLGIPFTVTKCNYAANVVNCPECAGQGGASAKVGMPISETGNNATINGIIDSAFATFPAENANSRGSRMTVYDQINAEIQKRGLNYVVYEKGDTTRQTPKDTVICCCWDEDRKVLGITFTVTKCNYASNVVNCPTCKGSASNV